jgi:hypothetical protein
LKWQFWCGISSIILESLLKIKGELYYNHSKTIEYRCIRMPSLLSSLKNSPSFLYEKKSALIVGYGICLLTGGFYLYWLCWPNIYSKGQLTSCVWIQICKLLCLYLDVFHPRHGAIQLILWLGRVRLICYITIFKNVLYIQVYIIIFTYVIKEIS